MVSGLLHREGYCMNWPPLFKVVIQIWWRWNDIAMPEPRNGQKTFDFKPYIDYIAFQDLDHFMSMLEITGQPGGRALGL